MAISATSYEIILPDSRQFVIVNAQPGERVDNLLIINPSPTQVAMIQCYEDIQSVLFDDGGPAYTTHLMKLEMNKGLVTSLISLDGSEVVDHETYVMITSNIMKYHESLHADDLSEETTDQEKEEEEEDICAICLQEFEVGETCVALECNHGYHQECIEKWLQQKNNCPICRAKVFSFFE
ncbi:putative transcription factor C2H2 family [Helianthus annuus]|uniref:RING-type E3 ubiquitin transferase n=1 Tax=Helianthus annuus TaxID=4232 RepID=A0A251U6U0_HELAN|nr:putative transcription factor C2H2 family [Helianthus annuus]KAJ0546829.1 putative transcription factor C2H2 family [Helianthus annuus]KAJ0719120.1 putative transcription factor C2H2 family [Helianthus annuus]KAJ0722374.1 putative transcription factor C2H2 family [Helianthus annuus]KAJ0901543.1 putative transcription factor C2H2 family [Helianthus annuus]